MSRYFTVLDEITLHSWRFNAEGRELTVRMLCAFPARTAARDPDGYFAESVDEIFNYSLRDLKPGDMVGISIHNVDNQQGKPIGLSFRRRKQLSRDVL